MSYKLFDRGQQFQELGLLSLVPCRLLDEIICQGADLKKPYSYRRTPNAAALQRVVERYGLS